MDNASNTANLFPIINIEDEMKVSYIDYAMSVIVGRALPDARDGLKPVQRRILYSMFDSGLLSSKKHSKCAGVVGQVLRLLHPHGDAPVYEALARLAQPWNLRYLLIDGQGNFGSVDGDPPAAYRYTECRLTAYAEALLEDLDKETVDFIPNFDNSTSEPLVLPTLVPNMIVNGASGIAVGMATNMPPHNLSEVIDGTIALIENPKLSAKELNGYITGPDFPTGGMICGREPIARAYATGKGIITLRGRWHEEKIGSKNRENTAIVITEIPYQVNKAKLHQQIAELVAEKKIEGIAKVREESDRSGMRLVVELKKDATLEIVKNQLVKLTDFQITFGIINLAIVEGKPQVCSLAQLLFAFINHRRDVVTRRAQFELRKSRERIHLLEGFRIVLADLDNVIQLIKGSETPQIAASALIDRYALSDMQAQAILELRLQRLTGMERLAIENEFSDLQKLIEQLTALLADSKKIDDLIIKELKEVKSRFGDKRRTLIEDQGELLDAEDLIEDEDVVITLSHQGYIKRTKLSEYRAQKRGGKGVYGAVSKEDDFIEHLFTASTKSYLLVFTSLGKLHWIKVYEIPEAGRAARGRAIVNLLKLSDGEKLTAILSVREFNDALSVLMVTEQGLVKRTALSEFSRIRSGGIIACTLDEGDRLAGVAICGSEDQAILASQEGMSIRFAVAEVRVMGRGARGVRGINLDQGDRVIGMVVIPKLTIDGKDTTGGAGIKADTLLTICENGYGKRTEISEYREQSRGGKGVIDIQTDERNGKAVSVCLVGDQSEVMLITSAGKIIRISAKEVSVVGRNTKGVRLIGLDQDEKVSAATPLAELSNDLSDEGV
ncbi:MAG TPA: DNA gyrase subunit A [Oligoflexia bacterium]|nr:DNA gyrase subunit A [Oligoflexia bacterium]HMP27528.1 DNA gyrase subunit A [Oligoflexia bacterium]